MLPAPSRLRSSADFATALKGRRSRQPHLIAHFAQTDQTHPPRVGLIVNSLVGGSVVRHQVARRIRHLTANHLDSLPSGSLLVFRALPQAASADSSTFDIEISAAVKKFTDDAMSNES